MVLRNLPGSRFCFAILEMSPGSSNRVAWQIELPLEQLPTALAEFRRGGAFDSFFKAKVKNAVEHLERIRSGLGIEMTIEEAMR